MSEPFQGNDPVPQVAIQNETNNLSTAGNTSLLEIQATGTDDISYRFVVNGLVEKTDLGPGHSAADANDTITEHGNGTVVVTGSTGGVAGDAYIVRGGIVSATTNDADRIRVLLTTDISDQFVAGSNGDAGTGDDGDDFGGGDGGGDDDGDEPGAGEEPINLSAMVEGQTVIVENPSDTSAVGTMADNQANEQSFEVSAAETVTEALGPGTYTLTAETEDSDAALINGEESWSFEIPDSEPGNATLILSDQESDGTTVTVEEANLSEGGFIAIYEEPADGVTLGNVSPEGVIGVSEYLQPGTHENVTVGLFESVSGAEFDQEVLDESEHELVAVAHRDTNDTETFQFVETDGEVDGPYLDEEGNPIQDTALVTINGDTRTIDSCTIIDEPGYYELTENLEAQTGIPPDSIPDDPTDEVCIAIRTSDVVLEGNGNLVEGVGADRSVGVQVYDPEGNTVENVTVQNLQVESWTFGIEVGSSSYVEPPGAPAQAHLENVEANENERQGIFLALADSSELEDVTVGRNGRWGLFLLESRDVTVDGLTATQNEDDGLFLREQTRNNEFTNVTATGNGGNGITVSVEAWDNVFSDIYVADNDQHGIMLDISSDETIRGATIENNGGAGILAEGQHELEEVTVRENGEWQVRSAVSTITATALQIGDSAEFSFTQQEAISLDRIGQEALLALPNDTLAAGDGVNVTGVANAEVSIQYDEETVAGDIELWRHTGAEWTSVETFDTNETSGTIETTITEDGVYAPLESEQAPAEFTVSALDPRNASVTQGEQNTVSATVENVGDEAGDQTIELRIDDTVVAERELALGANESTTVLFEGVSTDEFEAGEYEHGVFSEDDEDTGSLTIEEQLPARYVVSELNPEVAMVIQGEEIDVSATVENVGTEPGNQTVELRLDGEVLADQDLELDGGETTPITFEDVDTADFEAAEYEHGIFTEDSEVTGTLTIEADTSTPAPEPDTPTPGPDTPTPTPTPEEETPTPESDTPTPTSTPDEETPTSTPTPEEETPTPEPDTSTPTPESTVNETAVSI